MKKYLILLIIPILFLTGCVEQKPAWKKVCDYTECPPEFEIVKWCDNYAILATSSENNLIGNRYLNGADIGEFDDNMVEDSLEGLYQIIDGKNIKVNKPCKPQPTNCRLVPNHEDWELWEEERN